MTWLVEEGIGEHRAVRLSNGRIAEARIDRPGTLAAGHVADAVLIARAAGSSRGTVRLATGEEALVDRLPRTASEGASIRVEAARAAVGESGRHKMAHVRPSERAIASPTLAQRLRSEGYETTVVHRFPANDWDELVGEALDGAVAFAGGSLLFAPTPAMTVVDIDGSLPPRDLSLAAVAPLADAIRRFDLGGSIGIDFPTLSAKADRRAVDEALGVALADRPHERTAMNGFGFVQIVARLERPSLLHLAAYERTGLIWHRLLRTAERLDGPGAIELTVHPELRTAAARGDCAELERRAGRMVRVREDAGLALEAPHAQLVPA